MIKPVTSCSRHSEPYNNLRKWQGRDEIDDEVRLKIPPSNGLGIHHKLASTKHSSARIRSDETGPELDENVEQVEKIRDCSEEGDEDSQARVGSCAGVSCVPSDGWHEEVQRVDEESNHTGDDEDPVPFQDYLTSWIKNRFVPRELARSGLVVVAEFGSISVSDSVSSQEIVVRL